MSKNTVYSVLEYVLLVFIGVYPYIHRKLCGRTTKSGAEIICFPVLKKASSKFWMEIPELDQYI